MAFDGIMCAALVRELKELEGGRIAKVSQPERDEILMTVRTKTENKKILISANASLPFFCLTDENKPSPAVAPSFCMSLRKHIAGGHIKSISQSGLERIVFIDIEHLNEMGDMCIKRLILEMMGKYSNIILCDENDTILDAIKHVAADVSSLREVLCGRKWFFPETLEKKDPLKAGAEDVLSMLKNSSKPYPAALVAEYSGISFAFAYSLNDAADADPDIPATELSEEALRSVRYLHRDVSGH